MKRFHKALLTAAACAALLISAQAAEPQDVLQTVLPVVQQEWQSTGTVSTTYFSGDDYLMQLSSLVPEKHLYTVILSTTDDSGYSFRKCGVFDPQTGKLVVPLEYDSIEATPDSELVLCQWGIDSPRYWFADDTGALTQIELPAGVHKRRVYYPDRRHTMGNRYGLPRVQRHVRFDRQNRKLDWPP